MIIIAKLPESKYYSRIESDRGFLFADRRSPKIQILSPMEIPWGHTWEMVIQENKNKSDSAVFLTRIRFNLKRIMDESTHTIVREEYKGDFGYSYACAYHYCLLYAPRLWLDYTVKIQ